MEQRQLEQRGPSQKELLRNAPAWVQRYLPPSWSVGLVQDTGAPIDAYMDIFAPEDARARLVVEVKRLVEPRDVASVAAQLDAYAARFIPHASTLLVAPFLSRQTRGLLEQAGISYLDATGNIRVRIDRPALFIRDVGAKRDPWRTQKGPLHSLKGRAAGRVVRALCDFQPPFGIREISGRSQTSLASTSRVASFLEREALLTRGPRGEVVDVRYDQLIERWVDDYSLTKSNRTTSYIEPRGFDALLRKARDLPGLYAITGSLAAVLVAPIASTRLAVLFVEDHELGAKTLGLRPVDTGANVLLVEPFDPVVFDRMVIRDGQCYAALSQVAADLLTSPGRGPEEGEELLRWMKTHEQEWRARP